MILRDHTDGQCQKPAPSYLCGSAERLYSAEPQRKEPLESRCKPMYNQYQTKYIRIATRDSVLV